jgi:hypothetical protein
MKRILQAMTLMLPSWKPHDHTWPEPGKIISADADSRACNQVRVSRAPNRGVRLSTKAISGHVVPFGST